MMKILKALTMVFSLASIVWAANWNGSTSEPENTVKVGGKIFYAITSPEELLGLQYRLMLEQLQ